MQKLQQGFTLIELMIVVAIIGILAALAVPAYQDYTIRTKVGEAASLASAARTAVDIYYSENGSITGSALNQTSLGLSNSASYNAKYVSSVAVGNGTGIVTAQLRTMSELGTASGTTVVYTPNVRGGNLEWTVGGTVPGKYQPRR